MTSTVSPLAISAGRRKCCRPSASSVAYLPGYKFLLSLLGVSAFWSKFGEHYVLQDAPSPFGCPGSFSPLAEGSPGQGAQQQHRQTGLAGKEECRSDTESLGGHGLTLNLSVLWYSTICSYLPPMGIARERFPCAMRVLTHILHFAAFL